MSVLPDLDSKGFPVRFKEAMEGETPFAFSKRTGISDTAIRQYLNGGTPGIDKAEIIAKATNVSLDWLILGRGDKRPIPLKKIIDASGVVYSYLHNKNQYIDIFAFKMLVSAAYEIAVEKGVINEAILDEIMQKKGIV